MDICAEHRNTRLTAPAAGRKDEMMETTIAEIIKQLKESRQVYLAEAGKCAGAAASCPEYWEGKASGLLMAIETINFIVANIAE
jgi:hypothetical protein